MKVKYIGGNKKILESKMLPRPLTLVPGEVYELPPGVVEDLKGRKFIEVVKTVRTVKTKTNGGK